MSTEEELAADAAKRLERRPLYAVVMPADQTIIYAVESSTCGAGECDCDTTTRHLEATLFPTKLDAAGWGGRHASDFDIEEVLDVEAFRAREDTW